ncbi:MAG: hypothetical protein GXY32_07005 [Ruminococcaceae bacterium]|nr:hypothetical protein [Oscillospiraceae bacterium]
MNQSRSSFLDVAGQVAEGAVRLTGEVVARGRDKVDQMALNGRLMKLHRQLGALVYSQKKTGREDEQMLDWYIAEIDRVKRRLAALEMRDEQDFTVYDARRPDAEDDAEAMFRAGGQP